MGIVVAASTAQASVTRPHGPGPVASLGGGRCDSLRNLWSQLLPLFCPVPDLTPPVSPLTALTLVPCLRRANALNYTDNDEDAEKLLSFLEEADAAEPDGEWVATHMGRCKLRGLPRS